MRAATAPRGRRALVAVALSATLFLSLVAWQVLHPERLPAQPAPSVADAGLLVRPVGGGGSDAEVLRRGQYLVRAGDCLSCHLRAGGRPFAGGLGLNTPFGVIYSSNITSDRRTGIGAWTPDEFYRAMHDGVGREGERLYPAFPYPWFTHVSRSDAAAMLAFLKTTPAVDYVPPANRLPFPTNVRLSVAAWNALFLDRSPIRTDPSRGPEWNRGALLVNGLGHCSACHTPKNLLGADRTGEAFRGGGLENSFAPDLTSNPRTGLGRWSRGDIVEYLRTGRSSRASASSQMADVITYSTSMMSDADLGAIATYLKSLPPSPDVDPGAVDRRRMVRGAAIYSDACTACHLERGDGQRGLFPPLPGSAMAQQADPTGLIHLILAGGRVGPSPSRPSPLSMPSFAWKLDDEAIADVATFVRNSWGNAAPEVRESQVRSLRFELGLRTARLTVNSGDHGR